MSRRGLCNIEDGSCAPGPTTSWEQTVFCSRTWWPRKHGTTRTITWSWVSSVLPRMLHTCDISVNTRVSPSNRQRPHMRSTACLWSSGGAFTSHLRGNTYPRHGYHSKPGVLYTPRLRHAIMGIRGTQGRSSGRSRQASKKTGFGKWSRLGLRWIPSSCLIRLSF